MRSTDELIALYQVVTLARCGAGGYAKLLPDGVVVWPTIQQVASTVGGSVDDLEGLLDVGRRWMRRRLGLPPQNEADKDPRLGYAPDVMDEARRLREAEEVGVLIDLEGIHMVLSEAARGADRSVESPGPARRSFSVAKPAVPSVVSAPVPDEPVPFNARTYPQNADGAFGPVTLSQIGELISAGRLPRNGRPPNARPEW